MKKKRLLKLIPFAIIILLLGYSAFWVSSYSKPTQDAVAILNNNSTIDITRVF